MPGRRTTWRELRRVIDVDELLDEHDANTQRKAFTPTEAVAIGARVEERHRERIAAKAHAPKSAAGKRSALARGNVVVDLHDAPPALGATRDAAVKAVGMGSPKYDQAKRIVAAAEAAPEPFR